MATFETYPLAVEPTSRNVELLKSLGSLALVSSPLMLVAAAAAGFDQPSPLIRPLIGLLGFLHCLGWLCSLAGLHLTGAMGRGLLERKVLAMQAILVAVTALWSLGQAAVPGSGEASLPFALGVATWPIAHFGMIAVGAAVVRADSWTGWTRFAPLLCGLSLPLALLTGVTGWAAATSIPFAVTGPLAFALLAWTVRTSGARLR